MIGAALKSLAGRKLRAALTALAIVLGVSMVSGTYVLTDTIAKAFDSIFTDSYKGTDVVVSGKEVVQSPTGRATVPESLVERIRGVEGVASASGTIEDGAKIIGKDGKAINTQGAPSLAFGVDTSRPGASPLELVDGRWPSGRGEMVIDAGTAKRQDYSVGDSVGVSTRKPVRRFEVVGIVRFGSVDSIGSATITVFDVPTAQELFDKRGRLDSISVTAERGVRPKELARSVEGVVPPEAQVKTASAQAEEDSAETAEGIGIVQKFLLAFGGVALFVGAFVIFNTLSITVAQRAREFAIVRTLGASRRQVLASVVIEALAIGLLASVAGLFLGLALAKGLNALFVSLGIDLPQTGTVFATRTIVVSLLIGVLVTLGAGLFPALRATRVPPIAAVREGAVLPPSRLARYSAYIAAVTAAAGLALLVYGMFSSGLETMQRLVAMGVGCLLLFAGIALVSSRLVTPLASVLGWPARAIAGSPGELAHENSVRNPGRTAATAAALMIGLALVTFVAVLGNGMRASVEDAVDRQVRAEYVLTAQDDFSPLAAGAGEAVAKAPLVEVASRVGQDTGRVEGDETMVSGVDENLPKVFAIEWEEGSDRLVAQLGERGAILEKSFAEEHQLEVGSSFVLESPQGDKLGLLVEGTYERREFSVWIGNVLISREAFEAAFPRAGDVFTFANVRGGSGPAGEELERAVAEFPDAKVQSKAEFAENQTRGIGAMLNLLYVLLALSVVVSLFGMVNTLVLSVFERTRELGLLRAVGMTRRQARRMVRHESVITALIGGALGIPLGVFLAALVTQALSDEGVVFSVPALSLAVFALVAVVAGILAAILPARRASQLNVLEALQYE